MASTCAGAGGRPRHLRLLCSEAIDRFGVGALTLRPSKQSGLAMIHMFDLARNSKSGKNSDVVEAVSAIEGVRSAKMHVSTPNRLVVDVVGVSDLQERINLAAAASKIIAVPL